MSRCRPTHRGRCSTCHEPKRPADPSDATMARLFRAGSHLRFVARAVTYQLHISTAAGGQAAVEVLGRTLPWQRLATLWGKAGIWHVTLSGAVLRRASRGDCPTRSNSPQVQQSCVFWALWRDRSLCLRAFESMSGTGALASKSIDAGKSPFGSTTILRGYLADEGEFGAQAGGRRRLPRCAPARTMLSESLVMPATWSR